MRTASVSLLVAACVSASLAASSGCGDDAPTSTTSNDGGGGSGSTTATTGSSSSSTSTGDGGASDASSSSSSSGGAPCVDSLPVLDAAPDTLSATGFFADVTTDTIAPYVRDFTPAYPLWTDGAEKRRWIYLPECAQVDTSNIDVWSLPVGTRLWKEFTRDGVRIETRLTLRTGPGANDFEYATYLWDSGVGNDPVRITEGLANALGTDHDVPADNLCASCHKTTWPALGFSAVQLTHDGPGLTMASLSAEGRLSVPRPDGVTVPGNDVERAALGYLHSNCGSCHHAGGVPNVSLLLKVLDGQTTPEATDTYATSVNKPTTSTVAWTCAGCDRVEPGNPDASAMFMRSEIRGTGQMPPVGTELVHPTGLDVLRAWIEAIPPAP